VTIREMIEALELTVVSAGGAPDDPLTGGYVSDLLSHVMGQAKAGQAWITMQGHQNIVAVASLVGLGAVIVAGGVEPEEQTIAKANDQEVVLCKTKLSTYEVAGRLYQLAAAGK
jgi:hypothetical protein